MGRTRGPAGMRSSPCPPTRRSPPGSPPAHLPPPAIASTAGVSFSNGTGPSIPVGGFPQLTLLFSLVGVGVGVGLAAIMARTASRPRLTFVWTAIALTILLLLAAAIVVPTLAGQLARAR